MLQRFESSSPHHLPRRRFRKRGHSRPHSSEAEHFFGKEEVLGPIPSVGWLFATYAASPAILTQMARRRRAARQCRPGQVEYGGFTATMGKAKFERTKPHVNIG